MYTFLSLQIFIDTIGCNGTSRMCRVAINLDDSTAIFFVRDAHPFAVHPFDVAFITECITLSHQVKFADYQFYRPRNRQ